MIHPSYTELIQAVNSGNDQDDDTDRDTDEAHCGFPGLSLLHIVSSHDESPRLLAGRYGIRELARSPRVMDCMTILPGPVSVVTNSPSPPNRAVLIPPAAEMS